MGDLFKANGVCYCRVDGSLPLGQRKKVLTEFQENPEVGVLAMTLGTGAVGYVDVHRQDPTHFPSNMLTCQTQQPVNCKPYLSS